jgi:hypothetical protein
MKAKKPEPKASLLDELGAPLRDFVADFKVHGKDALEQVRTRDPGKYLELAAKLAGLVATLKTADGARVDFNSAQSNEDLGRKLLQAVGFPDPDDAAIQAAIEANNILIARLQSIKAAAEGAMQ